MNRKDAAVQGAQTGETEELFIDVQRDCVRHLECRKRFTISKKISVDTSKMLGFDKHGVALVASVLSKSPIEPVGNGKMAGDTKMAGMSKPVGSGKMVGISKADGAVKMSRSV